MKSNLTAWYLHVRVELHASLSNENVQSASASISKSLPSRTVHQHGN